MQIVRSGFHQFQNKKPLPGLPRRLEYRFAMTMLFVFVSLHPQFTLFSRSIN